MLRGLDIVLITSLFVTAGYTYFYAKNKEFMIIVTVVILAIVSVVGRIIFRKVSLLRVQLDMLLRTKKTEEQRTIMSTRHTTRRSTKSTMVNTNPTNPTTTKK